MATLSNLTPREEAVLRLVLTGRTNKAFAAQISTSEKTVQFHLNRIYTKIEHERARSRGFGQFCTAKGQKLGKFLARFRWLIILQFCNVLALCFLQAKGPL